MMPVGRERKDSIYDILTPHKTDYYSTIIVTATGSSLNKLSLGWIQNSTANWSIKYEDVPISGELSGLNWNY